MRKTFLFLLALMLMAGGATAGRTYVLVAGVSNYQNDAADLSTTTSGVKRIAQVMQKHSQDVSLITSRYATREKLLSKLQEIAKAASADDRIIFYFCGHGDVGGILAYDMSLVHYAEIIDILASSKAGTKMVFVDVCRSGSANSVGSNDIWREKLTDGNIMFMLSSRAEEFSSGDIILNAGWFTHAFLKGLEGRCDTNKDKGITVKELFTYVYNDVVSRSEQKQHPQLIATKEMQNAVVVTW